MKLSDNELVTLLLCSDIALSGKNLTPFSDVAYSAFARALYNSGYQPSDLLSMSKETIRKICEENSSLFTRLRRVDFENKISELIKRHQQLFIELDLLNREGIRVITRADICNYPKKIKNKLKKAEMAYPSVIYYAGQLSLIDSNKSLAVVGSRNLENDSKAIDFTEKLVRLAVEDNYAISSGGAKGIDIAAQKFAFNCNAKTIITVSDGLSKKIREKAIRDAILNGESLYISLVNPKSHFSVYNAMGRNKIIYAVSDYAAVISCSYHTKLKKGIEVIDMNKGGTWVGIHECYKHSLSKILVRSYGQDTVKGNLELLRTLPCIELKEEYLNKKFSEIIAMGELNTIKK